MNSNKRMLFLCYSISMIAMTLLAFAIGPVHGNLSSTSESYLSQVNYDSTASSSLPIIVASYCQEKSNDEPENDVYTGAMGPVVPYVPCYGSFPDGNDRNDYYFILLTISGRVELWLSNIPYGSDYNLTFRDANLNPVGYSGNNGNNDEYIHSANVLPAGIYYMQVQNYGQTNNSNAYELRALYILPSTSTPTVLPSPTATNVPTPTPTGTTTPELLFFDDFENGIQKWSVDGEGWQLRQDLGGNHYFCVNALGDYQYAQAGSGNWQDYALEADVLVVKDTTIGSGNILFRISDQFYPLYVFSFYKDGSDLAKEKPKYQWLDSSSTSLERGVWHFVRIEIIDASINIFLNGIQEPILQAIDSNSISRGSFAIGAGLDEFPTEEIDVCFDNITVNSLP